MVPTELNYRQKMLIGTQREAEKFWRKRERERERERKREREKRKWQIVSNEGRVFFKGLTISPVMRGKEVDNSPVG